MSKLYVNIDHVATLRNQRGTIYPDIVEAAKLCIENGAKGITIHLREDRRHINDNDVKQIKDFLSKHPSNASLNLEMAATDEMEAIALKTKPEHCCIVPEKREELTTEGGLNVEANFEYLKKLTNNLQNNNIEVSLFIEPEKEHINISKEIGAKAVEIHTGAYANATNSSEKELLLSKINEAIDYATSIELKCNVGHGLEYENTIALTKNKNISEFNTGHSIISRAVLVGLAQATREMGELIN